jgi:hypothetical protein
MAGIFRSALPPVNRGTDVDSGGVGAILQDDDEQPDDDHHVHAEIHLRRVNGRRRQMDDQLDSGTATRPCLSFFRPARSLNPETELP